MQHFRRGPTIGAGADRILVTASGSLTGRIACGTGRDTLTVTSRPAITRRAVKRRASGCETVRVAAAPAPAPTPLQQTADLVPATLTLPEADPVPPLPELPPLPVPRSTSRGCCGSRAAKRRIKASLRAARS